MNDCWYRLLVRVSRVCGTWFYSLAARIIAAGYFVFSGRAKESRRLYRALFPRRNSLEHLWLAFTQFQHFTTIHLDRFLLAQGQTPRFTSEGWERLEAVIGGSGGILLMSHLGNWEMGARALKQQRNDLHLLLYMGVKEKEGVERMQKEELRDSGVTVIGVEQEGGSPLAAVEALRFLRAGGLVSMTGDMVWRGDQRRVRVRFLNGHAWLPEAPYLFSLLSGAPLYAFFIFRTGPLCYHFSLSQPLCIPEHSRSGREQAIAGVAQQYADLLEKALQAHPRQWYHFNRFLVE